jgi:hypothetical protein
MKKLVDNILIDLTSKEIAQREQDAIQGEQEILAYKQKIEQDIANKQSAMNKLKALGLNDAEIKSIIG